MKVNWLFKNVTVIDGSGGPQFRGDVAVKGDRIVDMAPALNLPAEQVIDGQGRVLAPGFTDVHTHDDTNVIRTPAYLPKLSQGVTTVIVGNCGISAATATLRDGVPECDHTDTRSPRRQYYRHLLLKAIEVSPAWNEVVPSHLCPVPEHRWAALHPLDWPYMGEARGNAVRRCLYDRKTGGAKPSREPMGFDKATQPRRGRERFGIGTHLQGSTRNW